MSTREEILEMCKQHFNEPILCGFELGRLIGFAEDDDDYYLVVKFPRKGLEVETLWISAAGGYVFLNRLKRQTTSTDKNNEEFNEYEYLDRVLTLNDVPLEEKFVEYCDKTN